MRVSIHNVGAIGQINDVASYELPPEVWTKTENMVCKDGSIRTEGGTAGLYYNDELVVPQMKPRWALPVAGGLNYLLLYAGLDKIYATDGLNHADISRLVGGAYNAAIDTIWSGDMLGKIAIVNNPEDAPQMWTNALRDDPSLALPVERLDNWPATYRAGVIRTHRNYIIAGDITKGAVNEKQLVLWSHVADINDVPVTWDVTDPLYDAGEYPLLKTAGAVKDFVVLNNEIIVYKEDSTYLMRYIGGRFIWAFEPLFPAHGIINTRCAKATKDGAQHVVVTRDDIVLHDGREIRSLLTGRMRKWLMSRIDPEQLHNCFLVPNYDEDEFIFFYQPTTSTTNAASAKVTINYLTGTVTPGFCEVTHHVTYDFVKETGDGSTIDSQTIPIDSMLGLFGQRGNLPLKRKLLGCSAVPLDLSEFYVTDVGYLYRDTFPLNSYCQRIGLAVMGQDRQGNPKVAISPVKQWLGLWPKITIDNGTYVKIRVGVQETQNAAVEWEPYMNFYPADMESVQFNIEGRLLAVEFKSESGSIMNLRSYDVDVEVVGEY